MSEVKIKTKEKEEKVRAFLNDILEKTFSGIAMLNEEEAETVLKSSCLACVNSGKSFINKNYGYDFEKPDLDAFLAADEKMEKQLRDGRASLTREENIIILDGYAKECICPLVKYYKIIKPFPNLCLCGKQWLKTILEGTTGRPVKVEILESPNRGGKSCRFKAELI